jgi:hypothetical protein
MPTIHCAGVVELERPRPYLGSACSFAADLETVQGRHQILDESVELAAGDPHPGVRFLHAASGLLARSPCGFADLIDQHPPKPDQVGLGELLVDPIIFGHAIPKTVDTPTMDSMPTQALVLRTAVNRHCNPHLD